MSFFKNKHLLKEGNNIQLTESQEKDKDMLLDRILSLTDKSGGNMLAFVGNFGSGKSTVINHIKDLKKANYEWIDFDVWRYSDRDQIWDGFVIEVIAKLSAENPDIKTLKRIAAKIEGEKRFESWINRNVALSIFIIIIVWLTIGILLWEWAISITPTNEVGSAFKWILSHGMGVLFAILAIMGIGSIFPRHRPMKRFFDFEEKLRDGIKSANRDIIVVIEDVDRVGEEGIVFLETLRQFLNNNKDLNRSILVIAPQSSLYLDVSSVDRLQGFERGIKIYDSVMYFSGSNLKANEGLKLLEEMGLEKKFLKEKEDLNACINGLLKAYGDRLSMRTYKFTLRELDEFMSAYPKSSAAIAYTLIMARHTYVKYNDQRVSALEVLSKSNEHFSNTSSADLKHFLLALIYVKRPSNYQIQVKLDFERVADEVDIEEHNTGGVRRIMLDNKYRILMA